MRLLKQQIGHLSWEGSKLSFLETLLSFYHACNKTEEFTIWRTAIYNTVNRYNLTQSVRQKDPLFIAILNKVRLDYFDEDVVQFINSRTVLKKDLPMNCLRLYTTREGMHNANKTDMKDFPGEGIKIPAVDNFVEAAITARRSLSKETRLLEELNINIGMRVMLIQNMNVSLGWVNNGAIATVVEVDEDNVGLQKYAKNDDGDDDEEQLYRTQRILRQVPGASYARTHFPIVPTFATAIHKVQSATIDCVGVFFDHMLTHGHCMLLCL